MGSNQTQSFKKRFYQVKVKTPEVVSLQKLGERMDRVQRQSFNKIYGKIWDLAMIEVSAEAIAALTQYYDQQLRCFTFWDFQLTPTIEEFEGILGCPIGGRKPYLFSGYYPSTARMAGVVKISERELDRLKQKKNEVVGIPMKCLEEKAENLASQGEWASFRDVLALLVFGVVLFPNVDGLVDLAAIDAFLAYHHSRESPVVAVLADLYDTFDRRCEKSGARIVCCTPALYVWLVSHFLNHGSRSVCPLQSHRMCSGKDKVNWEELLAGVTGSSISWFPRWKEGLAGVLCSCEGFSNVPLIGTRGCINYNPVLAIRQLGYPMRGAPSEETIKPFLARGFNEANVGLFQKIRKAWNQVEKKDKELRGRSNGIVGGYHEWLKVRIQEIAWLKKPEGPNVIEVEPSEDNEEVRVLKVELEKAKAAKGKLKEVVTGVRRECDRLRDINMSTSESLEQEMRKARGEESNRKRYQGALLGNSNELKLRRTERDKAMAENITLKDELKSCWESKESLKEQLGMMEKNMLVIIDQYEKKMIEEKQDLATIHGQALRDEQARVLALQEEREAREEVIDQLHEESMKWMNMFALTLNESQELPALLAEAKAMATVFFVPDEVHSLFDYCQHMIKMMTRIIRNR